MLKKLMACISLLSVCAFCQELAFPKTWNVFGPFNASKYPERTAGGLRELPATLKIGPQEFKAKSFTMENNKLDFGELISNHDAVWMFAELEAPKAEKLFFGAGCDWWMTWYVNGRRVFDTGLSGNGEWPPTVNDYSIEANLNKGKNLIAVLFQRGDASAVICAKRFAGKKAKVYKEPAMFTNLTLPRPRLFFTPEIIADRKKQLSPFQQEFLATLRKRLDKLSEDPNKNYPGDTWKRPIEYGHNAAYAALLWVFTGEEQFKQKGLAWLSWFTDWCNNQFANKQAVSWYSYTRIAALCAYDWLYNDMTPEQRTDIGNRLLKHLRDTLDTHTIFSYNGEGSSGPTAGYYGTPNLWWYAGIVFYKTGLDDALAVRMLSDGYAGHLAMFEHRSKLAGADGGPLTQSEGYVLGDYWKQEFRFFYAWKALFGKNYSDNTPFLAGLPIWISYCAILPKEPSIHVNGFGSGDCTHFSNQFDLPAAYLLQFPYFYAEKHPQEAGIASWLYSKCGADIDSRMMNYFANGWGCGTPGAPLLFDKVETTPQAPKLANAKYYHGIGMVYMRSGNGPDDTYVLFTAGGNNTGHKHADEGNFIIYKNGYQAMDTGARLIYSGMKMSERYMTNCYHNSNYFRRTIAHNCLLIMQPDEDFGTGSQPNGVHIKLANDGGMRQTIGSKMLHYESNAKYTYCHADLTAPYARSKAEKVERRFLFLYPDTIVIKDTVKSVKPEYRKIFVLHPGTEPTISGNSYSYNQTRVTALLPANARLEVIGGPGKEYWVDGQNWPTAPEDDADKKNKGFLYGDWRVETSPSNDKAETTFLHVIDLDKGVAAPVLNHNGSVTVGTRAGKVNIRFLEDGTIQVN